MTKSNVMLRFVRDVVKVVDKFHMRNHTGDWYVIFRNVFSFFIFAWFLGSISNY